jgi:hypothetical protein
MADGYKDTTEGYDKVKGYKVLGELDLEDIFAPFETANYGLPGGACTVDDYTEEGVMDAPYSRKQTSVRKLGDESTPRHD